MPGIQRMLERGIAEGIRLFNAGKFFEAHEALEAVWLKAKGPRKTFLHGLIQVAAAFHHHSHGNPAGFRSLLEKGCAKLEGFGAEVEGINLAGFFKELQPWRELAAGSAAGAPAARSFPQIQLVSDRASDPAK